MVTLDNKLYPVTIHKQTRHFHISQFSVYYTLTLDRELQTYNVTVL